MKRRAQKAVYHGESLLSYFSKSSRVASPTDSKQLPEPSSDDLKLISSSNISRPLDAQISPAPPVAIKISEPGRKCPFYKWIPGTSITVDAFSFGEIKGCDSYFLTHFHSDHFKGLTSNFKGTIYCSKVTKGFLVKTFGSKIRIIDLDENTLMTVSNVEVTALSANHCPGSVMFLFHVLSTRRFVLHTGDFRFSADMLIPPSPLANFVPNPLETEKSQSVLHAIYLDTTYCSPRYSFFTQDEVISSAIQITREQLRKDPSTLVICGMYTIGKERFVLGLASALKLTVWLPTRQRQLVSIAATHGCTVCGDLLSHTSDNPHKAQLHVVSMREISMAHLKQYRVNFSTPGQKNPFSRPEPTHLRSVLAWRPTGWSYRAPAKHEDMVQSTLDHHKPAKGVYAEYSNSNIYIYGAAYSEHSSFAELKEFILQLRPQRVQQTVFGGAAKLARDHISEWLQHDPSVRK
ncbi:unnamed protein product [Calicophoron daubneyi]|uniref:DNA repair metallo-beta-lactamase domain-containing protein n=1 Tax=Calicophoron daubneyi TaxID=300641 RepID=A0AAV2SY09_CALDB